MNKIQSITRFFTEGPDYANPRYDVQIDSTGISMGEQMPCLNQEHEFLFGWDELYAAMKEYAREHPEVRGINYGDRHY
jgi:hypothetical protein